MKLDARFINLVYKIADKDPQLTELNTDNIPEGALWINEVTGKVFIAIKHPDNPAKIVWLVISDTAEDVLSQLDFPTYNIVDIFNDNSIIAFYPFDGNVQDLANGYNITNAKNYTFAISKFKQGIRLKGATNTYATIPINLLSLGNFSVSLWVKPLEIKDYVNIFSIATPDYQDKVNFMVELHNDKFGIWTEASNDDDYTVYINIPNPLNKWILFYIERTQDYVKAKAIIEGQSYEVRTETYPNYTNNVSPFIGRRTNDSKAVLQDAIYDQFRIFNRALTTEEIIILYNENYLIKRALSILVDKFRTYKEIVFFPAGDLPSIQTGTKFHGGQIGQVTDTKPFIVDTGKETIGKELYFPDNSSIRLDLDSDLHLPITISAIVQIDKNPSGNVNIFGQNVVGQPPQDKIDFYWCYCSNKFYFTVELNNGNTDILLDTSEINFGTPYLVIWSIETDKTTVKLYDFTTKSKVFEQSKTFNGQAHYARQKIIELAKTDNIDYCNCGLHINQFRIFKGTLTDEEINLLLNEDKFYPVRTQYTPRVFVNKPSLNEDLIVFYNFDKIDMANKKIIDLSGNGRHGILKLAQNETIEQAFTNGVFGRALDCKGVDKRVTINNIPTDVDFITVSFWMKNTANTPNSVPFGFYHLNLWLYGGLFGFNNDDGAIYGIKLSDVIGYIKKWLHIVAVFPKTVTNSDYSNCELYINSQKQTLTYKQSVQSAKTSSITSTAYISGYGNSTNYPFIGYIDQFRMYKRKLTLDEIQTLYREMLWTIK